MPKEKVKSFLGKAKSWASKRGLFGPQAFLRFVMLTYLDSLKKLLSKRDISPHLNSDWINDATQQAWRNHHMRYKDLPPSLEDLFRDVNSWLDEII